MHSIFHTSHCGSTLLACMLSNSIPTITEPSWSHEARNINDLWEKVDFVKQHHPKNTVVKYSSLICDVAPHIEGKKVFLYRNFEDHVKKLVDVNKDNQYFNIAYEGMFWAQRFLWLSLSNDVLYVQTDYFLKNRHEATELVCNHLGIKYIPVDLPEDFNAKEKGFNHNDHPIKI
jgi:hypothetical protein